MQKNDLTKIQYPFMIKIPRKLAVEGNFLSLIKNIYIFG